MPGTARKRLPSERRSETRKFKIPWPVVDGEPLRQPFRMYVTVGMYVDGVPGEIFIRVDRPGSMQAGLLDGFAIMASLALQHGTPLRTIVRQLVGMKFEPAGFTGDPAFPIAQSCLDVLGRWLWLKWGDGKDVNDKGES